MAEKSVAPSFEKIRKEICQELAYKLRNPAFTNEQRLEFLRKIRKYLDEEVVPK